MNSPSRVLSLEFRCLTLALLISSGLVFYPVCVCVCVCMVMQLLGSRPLRSTVKSLLSASKPLRASEVADTSRYRGCLASGGREAMPSDHGVGRGPPIADHGGTQRPSSGLT